MFLCSLIIIGDPHSLLGEWWEVKKPPTHQGCPLSVVVRTYKLYNHPNFFPVFNQTTPVGGWVSHLLVRFFLFREEVGLHHRELVEEIGTKPEHLATL